MKFLKIEPHYFKIGKEFSFDIFIYDIENEQRKVALYKNKKLSELVYNQWVLLSTKGFKLQILTEDKKAVIEKTEITKEQIEEINAFNFKMTKVMIKRLKENKKAATEEFSLKDTIHQVAHSENDFKPLINRVKAEILCFPIHKSKTISLATGFVEALFDQDIHIVRSATLAYLLAKHNKVTDHQTLSEILISALVKDIGYCFIQTSLFNDFKSLTNTDIYYKHSLFSLYFLSKTELEITKNIKRFILEHHEFSDGSGIPNKKVEQFISQGSFLIHIADEILMCCDGKLDGNKRNLQESMHIFAHKLSRDGIKVEYPEIILGSLQTLIPSTEDEEVEKLTLEDLKSLDNQLRT